MKYIKKIIYGTLDVLRFVLSYFSGGTECLGCGIQSYVIPLCPECKREVFSFIPFLDNKRCQVCGKELISESCICLQCRNNPLIVHADGVFPILSYRLWKKMLLFQWKIRGIRALSVLFAELMHKAIQLVEQQQGLHGVPVVPVPPRRGKLRSTGWDQIEELCEYLNIYYGHRIIPVLAGSSIEQQKKLNRTDRIAHMQMRYRLKSMDIIKKIVNGKLPPAVFLVDDIITTGATAESCAALLKELGIPTVYVISLFIAD
jgi:competence protein ComFC